PGRRRPSSRLGTVCRGPFRREDGSPQAQFAPRYGLPRAVSPRGTVRRKGGSPRGTVRCRDSSPQATLWHHGLRVAKKRPFSYAEFFWQ
ncbi:MAG: hypothetical protein GY820_00520, partial [Gammaproteobacteria bacterium]|nr:hypothetical protein [Gammaproteobacteria bacterium]